ncbi:hypothetical protein NE664_12880, partial [Anaerotignum faecicola]|jgi:hypothetical protein|nr:hypothetical protein [Anaerotignum faecicola]
LISVASGGSGNGLFPELHAASHTDARKAALKTKMVFFIIIPSTLYLIIVFYQTQMKKTISEKEWLNGNCLINRA